MNSCKVRCLLAAVAATVVSFAAFAGNSARYSLDRGVTWTEVGAIINAFDAVKGQSSDAIIEALADGTIMPWGAMKDAQCNIILRSSTAGDDVYTLKRGSQWDGWSVSSGKTLTISNIVLDGGSQKGKDLLIVENGGTLRLEAGAVVTSSHADDAAGSAIRVAGDLYFEGGVVRGWRESSAPPVQIDSKGTVYIHSGGIEDCTQTSKSVGMPSAIGGCNISYFEDETTKAQRTVLYMTGGFIRNNTHTGADTAVRGALSFNRAPIVEISGGEISGNTGADESSCGVFMGNSDWGKEGVVRISGNPVIAGNKTGSGAEYNVHVEKSSRFVQIGNLTSGANIGVYSTGDYTENAVFGTLSTAGFMGVDLIRNDRDATLVGSADGTKLNWVVGSVVLDPEIREVSVVVNSTVATIGLAGVKMGTDDEAVPATSYSVSYSLDDGDPQKVLENQTGETASFDIAELTEGEHSCSVTITSDKGKTSAAKTVTFAVKIEIVDPSVGSVTVQPVSSTATVTLADIVRGTDAAGDPAAAYSVYYKLNGGESILALKDQSTASVDFAIEDLEDGDYSCEVWIVTDKEKASEPKSANFKINTSVGDFDALKAAIEGATDGTTITVGKGLYTATSTITVNANNMTIVSKDGKSATVLDAEGKCRLLVIKGSNCRIEGLTFKNGLADNAYGGAMDISGSARARIVNCDFVGCTAKWGGAICCGDNGHSTFDIRENYTIVSGCTFLECGVAKMGDGWGGGGAIYGAVWAEDSVFDACFTEAGGGLLYHADIDATSYMTATNCDFKNHNQANRGLVGINENRQGQGAVCLVDCLFAANTATSADSILFHRRVMLDRCVISNNMSTVETTTLTSLFRDMTAECNVRNCLFVDNQAPYEMNGKSMPSLENCTFVRNVGGLALNYDDSIQSVPQIKNCVFWGNLPKTEWPYGAGFNGVPGFYWHGGMDAKLKGFAPFVHTVVEGGSSNAKVKELLEAETDQVSIALTTKADTDGRVFVDLEGGNYEPAPRSALIDGGVVEDWMVGARDLAGNPRAKDGKVDLGCYERKATGMLVILR